jgi:hypothetical protein
MQDQDRFKAMAYTLQPTKASYFLTDKTFRQSLNPQGVV